ncbi:hypothetical protein IW262DRAFT_1233706, partial [Armillaria fumosa]
VNGIMALTLWDRGSTSTAMSPHFTDVSQALVFNLVEPVTLQLGTVGSRSKINFGMVAELDMAGLIFKDYVDVVNIDRYDLLIGTPFMHQHGVVLDFKRKCVCIDGIDIPAEILPTMGKTHDARHTNLDVDDDIERLRQHWYEEYEELLQGVPEGMPPWRIVNHEIPLVDNNARYHYHLPRCPNALRSEFDEK